MNSRIYETKPYISSNGKLSDGIALSQAQDG